METDQSGRLTLENLDGHDFDECLNLLKIVLLDGENDCNK